MREKTISFFDFIIYWVIVLIPFSMSIAPAPMNVFMGLLIASFLVKKILRKEPLFIRTALNIPLLFLFIITCLSLAHSVNFRDTIKGGILRLLQYIFVFFIIAQELKDKKHIGKVVLFMSLGILLTSFDEIYQILVGEDFIRGYAPIINIGIRRATASFKDSNTLGVYLSAISPFIFGLTLYYLKGIKKILFIFISILALIGIILTYSRPTLLAVYISFFFLGVVKKDKILVGFLILLTLLSPFIIPKPVKEWVKQVEYNPLRFMCNDDRIAVYRNSLNMIKAHPLIGVGANTYMKNYRFYKEKPEYRNIITSDYIYAHNNFLHMAAEIGLVGLGIFIWLLYGLFRESVNIYKSLDNGFLRILSLSLIASLVAFLVNGLTESSLYSSRVAMMFWYMAGFSLALKRFINAADT